MADPITYASMSIASFGESTLPQQTKRVWATKTTNLTQDIDGAQPKTQRVWVKPDLWDNSDVDGAKSMSFHRGRDNNTLLRVDDIDGAQAKIRDRMLLTKRNTNPMEPTYKLPSFRAAPHEEPKFVRNTLDISDIDKARPLIPVVYDMRDPISVDDIIGARANWRPRNEEARLKADPHNLMYTGDISKNTHRYIDRTSRHSDVNDPRYQIYGDVVEDNPKYTKPKPLKPFIADNHLLQTKDIAGAYSGWTSKQMERREFKNTNYTQDIEGAQADSIKHSISTTRCTHPLDKTYTSLDGDVLFSPVMSLLPPHIIKKPTLRNRLEENKTVAAPASNVNHVTTKDSLSIQVGKSEGPESDDHGGIPGFPSSGRRSVNASPRVALTAIDSAAYSTASPVIEPKIPLPKSTGNTPRSARLSNYGSNVVNSNNTGAVKHQSIAYADKFDQTQYMILPDKDSVEFPSTSGDLVFSKQKPPRSKPPVSVPALDIKGALSGRKSGSNSARGSSHSARLSKAEEAYQQEVLSVRELL